MNNPPETTTLRMGRGARSAALWLLALALLLPTLGGSAAAGKSRTLEGEYVWDRSNRGALEAVFTATGEGTWDVSFHFKFQGRSHTYSGTAEGNLAEGDLRGEVKTENRRRTFVFRGRFEEGAFRGNHAELQDGREYPTGTLTLGG